MATIRASSPLWSNRNVVACGGHFNGTNGTIISPNFETPNFTNETVETTTQPNLTLNYPLNTKCVWTITVPFNMSIQMVFDALDVEKSYDYIEVSCRCILHCICLSQNTLCALCVLAKCVNQK